MAETCFDGSRMRLTPHSRRKDKDGFLSSVLSLSAIAFIVTWNAVPWFNTVTMNEEESRAIETTVHYSGCDEVRAAGRAPLFRGDPGYGYHMDGDGDGIACEPYR